MEPGSSLDWPEPDAAARLWVELSPGGTVHTEVATDDAPRVVGEGTRVFLLSLKRSDLVSLHPRVDLARLEALRLEASDPVCPQGYEVEPDRLYGPVPHTARWYELDWARARFEPAPTLPSALTALRLSASAARDRPPPGHRVAPFGADPRVIADGWSVLGRPSFVNPTDPFNLHHRIRDAQALGEDYALVLQGPRLFVFARGATPLSSDQDLVQLHPPGSPDSTLSDRIFTNFVVLPGRAPTGAWRVIAASSRGEGADALTHISSIEVVTEPPSFRLVGSATVAGGSNAPSGILDPLGRALFIIERDRELGLPLSERRSVVVASWGEPIHQVIPDPARVMAAVGSTPLPELPHALVFEDGTVRLTDLLQPDGRQRLSSLPTTTLRGASSLAAQLDDAGRLWMAVGGETDDLYLFDPNTETWGAPRFMTSAAVISAAGCVGTSERDQCGLRRTGTELRDLFFHPDRTGRLWGFVIPKICPQVLAFDPDGVLAGLPVASAPGAGRALERMRPGWSAKHRLITTPLGELYELELD